MHEWWGLNDYVQRRARQLAELGYVVLAADMYGGGKATEATFKRQMASAGADFKVIAYAGAKHSFTSPAADEFAKLGLDIAYDAQADRASWRDMRAFLTRVFAN